MRVVFVGTPEFAVPTLRRLAHSHHDVIRVITRKDAPKGRGLKRRSPPVKSVAESLSIPVFQPDDINSSEAVELVRGDKPDVLVTAACSFILGGEILKIPAYGCINLHPSLLPLYRGVAPVQRAIMAGEKVTGVTTMLMDEGIDTGCILLQKEVQIGAEETAGELHDRLAELGSELVIETIEQLENGTLVPKEQDDRKATVAHRLRKKDGVINWDMPAGRIYNLIRGVTPWPGAQSEFQGVGVKITKAKLLDRESVAGSPGEIVKVSREGILVAGNPGLLLITELQPSGKRKMPAFEYCKGHTVEPGQCFGGSEPD